MMKPIHSRLNAHAGIFSTLFLLAVFATIILMAKPASAADSGDRLFPTPVSLPKAGEWDVRMLAPDLVEVRIVGTKANMNEPLKYLEAFFGKDGKVQIPAPTEFSVTSGGNPVEVTETGYRQLLDFATFRGFDVRAIGSLFLKLAHPLGVGESAEIRSKGPAYWPWNEALKVTWTGSDFNPAIHVNQIGYAPALPKLARAGLFLGSLGELNIPAGDFSLVSTKGEKAWSGKLVPAKEEGWSDGAYQKVLLADFSDFKTPGEYMIEIPGLGRSAPFRIHDDAMAYAARAYALGIYHQLCGGPNELPFTRFTHPACHTAPAEIPTMDSRFETTNKHIQAMSSGKMANVDASLFPIVHRDPVDVSGGFHDAGDYSKYMNSACVQINHFAFAADCIPGEKSDNLGLPESGDGIPDVLQMAKWEADFVAKMQDDDGGFYFLVYPRNRKYEGDVLPQDGDPQVVFPKNMISSAEAVGALAEMGSSPSFRKYYPKDAGRYMAAAKKGYDFLRRAVAEKGFEGAHQPVSHYGALFDHHDEMAYAAAAMFAATGDKSYENDLKEWWPDPQGQASKRWGWWHLAESYGSAARVYAFAQLSGRPGGGKEDPEYLKKMRQELIDAGNAQIGRAEACAYGIPIPIESKRFRAIGWYWAMDSAFDVVPAALLDESVKAKAIKTLSDASAYEFGENPSNRPFVTGTGNRWMREIVHQYAANDDRVLPPSGIPFGNVFGGPHNLYQYKMDGRNGLNSLFYPELGDKFPFYDRSGTDAFNVTAEFTLDKQARHLAGYLYLLSQTGTPFKPWKSAAGKIVGVPDKIRSGEKFSATLEAPGMPPLEEAQVVWEASGSEPFFGPRFEGSVGDAFPGYLEVEAVWPDGRRVFARRDLAASQSNSAAPAATAKNTLALVSFDELPEGRLPAGQSEKIPALKVTGSVDSTGRNVGWNSGLSGRALHFNDFDSYVELDLGTPDMSAGLTVSFWLYGEKFCYGVGACEIAGILQGGKRVVALRTSKWPKPIAPEIADAKGQVVVGWETLKDSLSYKRWHFYQMSLGADGAFQIWEDGKLLGTAALPPLSGDALSVRFGGFNGYMDDLHVQSGVVSAPKNAAK
ncbi:MAG: glycoside hydrolase family 9 protein [Verrucomicrobiota bacterium]